MAGLLEYLLGPAPSWSEAALAAVDVTIVGILVYKVLALIRGTRALQMLIGILLLGAGYLVSGWLELSTLNWVLGHILSYGLLFGFIVLFQADIRRALAQLGRSSLLEPFTRLRRAAQAEVVDAVVDAVLAMAQRRTGALIALERAGDLADLIEGGVRVDAQVTSELLQSLFYPGCPTHDGAVVVRNGRIAAARCVLPLAAASVPGVGTRHRAALGLAEEVDAAVVVVSEERGEISLAVAGALRRSLDEERLRRFLVQLTAPSRSAPMGRMLLRAVRSLLPIPEEPITRAMLGRSLPLALMATATALAMFLGVRGERVVTYRVRVPVESHLSNELRPRDPFPRTLEIALVGPWERLRGLQGAALGPLPLEVSRERPGLASWFVRVESLRLPAGVRVQSTPISSGPVELVPSSSAAAQSP
jgi:diadenylate cyclase